MDSIFKNGGLELSKISGHFKAEEYLLMARESRKTAIFDPFTLPSNFLYDHNGSVNPLVENFVPISVRDGCSFQSSILEQVELEKTISSSATAINSMIQRANEVVEYLDTLRNRLMSQTGTATVDDSFSAAQLLPLILTTAYCTIVINFSAAITRLYSKYSIQDVLVAVKNASKSNSVAEKVLETIDNWVQRIVDLVSSTLSEFITRINSTSGAAMVEYLSTLVDSTLPLLPILHSLDSANSRLERANIAEIISNILKGLRLRGVSGTESRRSNDVAFDDPEPSSPVNSRKQKHSNASRAAPLGDDSDDFMEAPSKRQRNAENDPYIVIDDYDDDAGSSQGSRYGQRTQNGEIVRINFSKEFLAAYCLSCKLLATFKPPSLDGKGNLDAITILSASISTENVFVNAEYYISIAESFAEIGHFPEVQRSLSQVPWLRDLGPLGYSRVLLIINSITKMKEFWSTGNEEAQKYFFDIVFLDDGGKNQQRRHTLLWQNRALQIECASNYMEFADISGRKADIQSLFIDSIADLDVRVRLLAASKLPLLLRLFKNKSKVYYAMLTASEVVLVSRVSIPKSVHNSLGSEYLEDDSFDMEENGYQGMNTRSGQAGLIKQNTEDPLIVFSTAMAIAHMGISDDTLTRRAVLDLMRVCCSRLKPPAESSDRIAKLLNQKTLLCRLMRFIALSLGYLQPQQLIVDYSRWILSHWLNEADLPAEDSVEEIATQSNSSQSTSTHRLSQVLTINDFPYYLVCPCSSLEEYSRSYCPIILPIVCLIDCPRRRWKVLLQFAVAAGYSGADNDVATLLKNSLCYLKATEIIITVSSKSKNVQLAEDFRSFLSRNLNTADIQNCLTSNISDTVQAIVASVCYESCPNDEEFETDNAAFERHLNSLLVEISGLLEINSLEILLTKCNMLEIFSFLRSRLLETQLSKIRDHISIAFKVLAVNLPRVPSKVMLHAVLVMTNLITNICPNHVADVSFILRKLTSDLCMGNYDLKQSDQKNFSDIFPQLFAELVSFNAVVSYLSNEDSTELDPFLKYYFHAFVSARVDKVELQKSYLHLSKALKELLIFCHLNRLSSLLSSVLPLPEALRKQACDEEVTERLQVVVASLSDCKEHLPDKLLQFVGTSSTLLSGECPPLSIIWMQVL